MSDFLGDPADADSFAPATSELRPAVDTAGRPDGYRLWELMKADFHRRLDVFAMNRDKLGRAQIPLTWNRRVSTVMQRTSLAVIFYRLSHFANKRRIPVMGRFFADLNLLLYGVEIDPGAVIGPGFYIGHPVGNVIGLTVMGKNVSVMGGVSIGLRGGLDPGLEGFPTIGDDVIFMQGSAVWGPIEVGSGSRIGSKAVLTQSVPAGSVVVAPKAQVIVKPPKNWPP